MCAIGLLEFSSEQQKYPNPHMSAAAFGAAHRINRFHCDVIERYSSSMRAAVALSFEDPRFLFLSSHVPARVDWHGGILYDNRLRLPTGEIKTMDDIAELYKDSWLRQHDTVPLALLALETEHRLAGLDRREADFLRRNGRLLMDYLGKIYMTPSSNAWEIHNQWIHAYDVAAIHRAFQTLGYFSREGIMRIPESDLENAAGLYRGRDGTGPVGFLRKHVLDGVVYAERRPFYQVDKSHGVDSEEQFIFTRFGIGDKELGEGAVNATMSRILHDRFRGNVLPTRFDNDDYYLGGRWLLLGMEYSRYLARSGRAEEAQSILNYVVGKYGTSLPEQETVDPESPHSAEGMKFLRDNGGIPIQNLAWSHGAFLSAHVAIEEAREATELSEKLRS